MPNLQFNSNKPMCSGEESENNIDRDNDNGEKFLNKTAEEQ